MGVREVFNENEDEDEHGSIGSVGTPFPCNYVSARLYAHEV